MPKQERSAKRGKAADKAATTIVTKAKAKVKAKAVPASTPETDAAARIQEMRGTGLSWAAIGAALGLAGSHTGAGTARKLYRAAYGEIPADVRASVQRSTKARRTDAARSTAAGATNGLVPAPLAGLDGVALLERLQGVTRLRWRTSVPYGFGPGAVIGEDGDSVWPGSLRLDEHTTEDRLCITWRTADEFKGVGGLIDTPGHWRSAYAQDVTAAS